MILISHRGNIDGINKYKENTIPYIIEAINQGYDVEIDVWFIDNEFWLGHDSPLTTVDKKFLNNNKLWVHCKNIDALYELHTYCNCFFINTDKVSLTSKNILWTYTGEKLTPDSICVLPELSNYTKEELNSCYGICSDYIKNYKL